MKNVAIHDLVPIQRVPIYYKRLFGKETDLEEVLTFVDHILRETGTIARKKLFIRAKVTDRKIGLPCGTYSVDSVTTSKPFQWYTPTLHDPSSESFLLNYIVPHHMYNGYSLDINTIEATAPFICEEDQMPVGSPKGNYVDYEHLGDQLKFNFTDECVDVVVRVIQTDQDGYPFITDKAAIAFAYWLNFVDVQRMRFKKMADASMLAEAQELAHQHIARARTPEAVSKNEMNDLLNVMTNMNRKSYNLPFGR